MKFCFIVIFLLNLSFIKIHAQSKKLEVRVTILPELKKVFENAELRLHIMADSTMQKTMLVKNGEATIIVYINTDSLKLILITAYITKAHFEKDYFLDTSFVGRSANSDSIISVDFPKRCTYNLNGANKVCPKCRKKNKVIPIIYGDYIPLIKKRGRIVDKKEYQGTSINNVCNPSWHCKRDNTDF